MELTISVRLCDKCKSKDRPTTRYTLAQAGAEPRERDLCDEDAAPLTAIFGDDLAAQGPPELSPLERVAAEIQAATEARPIKAAAPRGGKTKAEVPEQPKASAKKTAAKKTAQPARTAQPRARKSKTPIATMEQIDALKAAKAAKS